MLVADGNSSCHGLLPSSSAEITQTRRGQCQNHHWRWSGNPKGRLKFCKYCAILQNFHLQDCDWCSTTDGNVGYHGPAPSSSEEIARTSYCRRQKHGQLWPDYSKGRSKFRIYCTRHRNLHLRDLIDATWLTVASGDHLNCVSLRSKTSTAVTR